MKNNADKVEVIYMHSLAFTKCEGGKELVLSQNVYGDKTYRGECKCHGKHELKNGLLTQL